MGASVAEGSAYAVGTPAATPSLLRRQGSGSARQGGAHVVHTVTCRDLTLTALKAAAEGSSLACEEFTALNSVWRLNIKPNELRVGDAKGNNYRNLEVILELVTPDCTVPLDAFSAQVYGLGPKARVVQQSGLAFSTKTPCPPAAVAATTLCSVWRDSLWHIAEEDERAVLPGGCLTIGIQLRAAALTWGAGAVAALRPHADPAQALGAQLARLLAAGGDGDVLLDVTFTFSGPHAGAPPQRAHSFLLSLRSSVLRSQFRFPGQDAANGPPFAVAVPPEVTPPAMALLLRYIYTDGVEGVQDVAAAPGSDAAQLLTQLLVAANYYDIPGLLSLCDELVEGALCADNVLGALQLAHALCRERLCAGALRCAAAHVDELLDTREWAQLPAALQNAVVRTVRNHGEPASIRDSPPASRSRSAEDLTTQADGGGKRV